MIYIWLKWNGCVQSTIRELRNFRITMAAKLSGWEKIASDANTSWKRRNFVERKRKLFHTAGGTMEQEIIKRANLPFMNISRSVIIFLSKDSKFWSKIEIQNVEKNSTRRAHWILERIKNQRKERNSQTNAQCFRMLAKIANYVIKITFQRIRDKKRCALQFCTFHIVSSGYFSRTQQHIL